MYPFRGAPFTRLGISDQQTLREFIESPPAEGGLDGLITAADYPEGGEGRITRLN
jgi:5'-nucleotidase